MQSAAEVAEIPIYPKGGLGEHGCWVWVPAACDDVQVTFQVAIQSDSGIVIASDRLYFDPGDLQDDRSGTGRGDLKDKILVSEDGLSFCCASGDDIAGSAAEKVILERPSGTEESRFWGHVKDSVNAAIAEYESSNSAKNFYGYLIAGHRDQLWRVPVKKSSCLPPKSYGHVCEGNRSNPAGYFLERYVRHARVPLDSAIFIAAHSVLVAGMLNPLGVQGLEIVAWRGHAFERLGQEEISALIECSAQLDSDVQNRLLGRS